MNQDTIKQLLLSLRPEVEEFAVILSGKKSKKVNGLYKPASREIIIHNKNMDTEDALIYTAIHEFAHHIQFTQTHSPLSARYHTAQFYDIFHSLLFSAEKKGIYKNIFATLPEFQELTRKIKEDFLAVHGNLIQKLGQILKQALELCLKYKVSFDDYVDRILKIRHNNAHFFMKLAQLNINPAVGYENMKTLSYIKDEEERKQAEAGLRSDFSPDMIRARYVKKEESRDPLSLLRGEKEHIEKSIANLTNRLRLVNERIQRLEQKHGDN
jgi:hypothetical protein